MSEQYEYKTVRFYGGATQEAMAAKLEREGWELVNFRGRLCEYRRKISTKETKK